MKSDKTIKLEQLLKKERISNLKLNHELLNEKESCLESKNKVIDTRTKVWSQAKEKRENHIKINKFNKV